MFLSIGIGDLLVAGLSVVIAGFFSIAFYNVYLHPLSRYPGPISHAISRLPYCYRAMRGTLPFDMLELHKRYGDVVRIAPDELAFSHPDAWKDIMGHKKGTQELGKATWFYQPVEDLPRHIVNEEREEHGRLRRQMAHGFSEKSMRAQEPLIRGYVNLLLQRLREFSQGGRAVIISDWYNYTTFDIIGDLAFGEPFNCLEGSNYDTWIKTIFQSGQTGTILQSLSFYPLLKKVLLSLVPKSMRDAQALHTRNTTAKMLRRMEHTEERDDLIEGLLKKKDELNLTVEKLIANAEILIIGGSETTASALSGVTYLLLTNLGAYEKLKNEIRTAFQSQEEINLISVGQLPYLQACLEEGLRMYPPVANGLPRVCPPGGARILGNLIPEHTCVSMHQWALYRREEYFKEANVYHPERFLGHPDFKDDRREVLQPFHVGPRNCLGRNLAYSEMRLILVLIIFNFDLRLSKESENWMQQKNFLMWQKHPLSVYLEPVV